MSDDTKPSKLCRICLTSDVKMYMSIFEKYREFTVTDYILLLTSVEIKKEDDLPDKICASCFTEFETAIQFKQKCENSDTFLKTSRDKIIEACANADMKDIIIVKKEEPYDAEIKFEEATDDSTIDEYYGVEALEEISVDDIKPFTSKSVNSKVECHDCGNSFKSKCKLRVHWKKNHLLTSLICAVCKRQFKTYKALSAHRKKNTKSCTTAGNNLVRVEGEGKARVFHCKECTYKSRRIKDLQMHILTHSGDRPFQCNMCQNTYTQQSSLQSHMEGAHKKFVKEITCHICGKQVQGRVKVYRHMLTHTEARDPCPVCHKLFIRKNLKQHMLRHSDTKMFTCEKCASTFYTLAELCNHRRWVHNKRKDAYKCDLCDYTASRSDRIKIHRKNHTDSNVPCVICGMFFLNEVKMESHKAQHFAEKTHECPYCDLKFYRGNSVRKHIRSKHIQVLQIAKEQPTSDGNKGEEGNHIKIKIAKKIKKEGG